MTRTDSRRDHVRHCYWCQWCHRSQTPNHDTDRQPLPDTASGVTGVTGGVTSWGVCSALSKFVFRGRREKDHF